MQVRDASDEAPVHLLREGVAAVPGSQARFDVGDPDVFVECRQRSHRSRGRVPLHHEGPGAAAAQQLLDRDQEPRREVAEGLIRLHHAQVLRGDQGEVGEDWRQQLAMLARHVYGGGRPRLLERPHHGHQLDGFGSRPDEDGDLPGALPPQRAASAAPRSANIPSRYATMRPATAEAATVRGEAR